MEILNKILTLANKHSARFVSLNFVDFFGRLRHIDSIATNLNSENSLVMAGDKKFKFIEDKYFFDPFRSHPTIFCFCEEFLNMSSPRTSAKYFIEKLGVLDMISCECEINFLVYPKNNPILSNEDKSLSYDELDKEVNLRTEIIDILENIGIKTTYHCDGSKISECIIGIKAENYLEIADNILITKYVIMNVAESYGQNVIFTSEFDNNNRVALTLYLNFSNIKGNIVNSLFTLIEGNLQHEIIDNNIIVKLNKKYCRIEIFIKNVEINPYIIFTALILNANNRSNELAEIFSNEIMDSYTLESKKYKERIKTI